MNINYVGNSVYYRLSVDISCYLLAIIYFRQRICICLAVWNILMYNLSCIVQWFVKYSCFGFIAYKIQLFVYVPSNPDLTHILENNQRILPKSYKTVVLRLITVYTKSGVYKDKGIWTIYISIVSQWLLLNYSGSWLIFTFRAC